MVTEERIQSCNHAPVNPKGKYVLYWMIAYRRAKWNFSLEHAVECAIKYKKPLIILEALRCRYQWASDRIHKFIIDGMADNYRHFAGKSVYYYPYVEPRAGAGSGLLMSFAKQAALVVTDDFPCFFIPKMIDTTAKRLKVKMEKVDSNGFFPMRSADKIYQRAVDFRRFLQHNLPFYLSEYIKEDALAGQVLPKLRKFPEEIEAKWPKLTSQFFEKFNSSQLSGYPINHAVKALEKTGGMSSAEKALTHFIENKLKNYDEDRNEPQKDGTSGLAPYLHFGHISVHQVFEAIKQFEKWSLTMVAHKADGSKSGWWGMSKNAEAFLDQLITWRELGYNFCCKRDDYDQYESLPGWATKTMEEHLSDPRPYIYTLEEFEQAKTHDSLWNAAQLQLVREGHIHNYLRMLWGKKIFEWTPDPKTALDIMIELNNKYALDGRNPNSYSGIFWVLGRYDRPWGPERPIFGKIRYMSSDNTAKKFKVQNYIRKYLGAQEELFK